MPAWFSIFFILPTLFFLYQNRRHWAILVPPSILLLIYTTREEWNSPPQVGDPVTLMPVQIFLSIVLIYLSTEQGWLDSTSPATVIAIGAAFLLGLFLYYQTFKYIADLGNYGTSIVAFFFFSGLPILCGWAQSYYRR